ncbi:MAG: HEPN domain-containing protein [Gemmataceae bacterium]|nr:HEPN domain-containing protein [Gemmataceae bacterium]
MPTSRSKFRDLSDARLREATILLANGEWSGAYYLAGYAVECALKACIAKLTKAEEFPPPRKFVEQCYTHDIMSLVTAAGLEVFRKRDAPDRSPRYLNWETVKDWNEHQRYEEKQESDAKALILAITDPANGVLEWIKQHW